VEVVSSSAVACVTWVRGVCNLLRSARKREMILSMGLVGSSAVAYVACRVCSWRLQSVAMDATARGKIVDGSDQ
jgi:hypothetical protein